MVEIEKKNQQFTEFIKDTQMDHKYLCYDDNLNYQHIIPHPSVDSDNIRNLQKQGNMNTDSYYGIYQNPDKKP